MNTHEIQTKHARIQCILNYTRDTGVRYKAGLGFPAHERKEPPVVAVPTQVHNARLMAPDTAPRLHHNGFELVHNPTALTISDLYHNEDKIRSVYYQEIQHLVQRVTGAARVLAFHHLVRRHGQARDGGGKVGAPAGAVHCDYTVREALQLFERTHRGGENMGRFIVVNAWRNIADSPIQNQHLAMCDADTVTAPDDFVPCDFYPPGGHRSEGYRLDGQRAAFHRWWYYPGMVKDEVLLFMQYDSSTQSNARYAFHTAISDPTCPSHAPPRQSMETRLIAFFPGALPNSIPAILRSYDERIDNGVDHVFNAIKYLHMWPAPARLWVRGELHLPGGVGRIIHGIIKNARKKGEGGLGQCSDDQIQAITQRVIARKEEFAAYARQYFDKN